MTTTQAQFITYDRPDLITFARSAKGVVSAASIVRADRRFRQMRILNEVGTTILADFVIMSAKRDR